MLESTSYHRQAHYQIFALPTLYPFLILPRKQSINLSYSSISPSPFRCHHNELCHIAKKSNLNRPFPLSAVEMATRDIPVTVLPTDTPRANLVTTSIACAAFGKRTQVKEK